MIISQLSETITVCTLEDYHFWEGVPAQVLSPQKTIQGHTETVLLFGMTGPQKTNPNTSLNTTFQGYSQGCLRIHAFQGGCFFNPNDVCPSHATFQCQTPELARKKNTRNLPIPQRRKETPEGWTTSSLLRNPGIHDRLGFKLPETNSKQFTPKKIYMPSEKETP